MVGLSTWWVRLLAYLGWITVGLIGIVLIPGVPPGVQMTALTLFLAAGVIVIEVARPGGALFTSGLGLTPRMPIHSAMGVGLAVASLASIAGVAVLMGAAFTLGATQVSLLALLALAMQSAAEEFVFRGTLFESIRERFGALPAIILTSVLFGLLHANNPGAGVVAIVNVMLAGALMGTMVARSGSLWMAVFFHAGWNLGVGAFFGSVSGSVDTGWIFTLSTEGMPAEVVWFITGPFGIEQGMVTTIVLTAGIVVVNGWVRMDRSIATARLRRARTEHHLI